MTNSAGCSVGDIWKAMTPTPITHSAEAAIQSRKNPLRAFMTLPPKSHQHMFSTGLRWLVTGTEQTG